MPNTPYHNKMTNIYKITVINYYLMALESPIILVIKMTKITVVDYYVKLRRTVVYFIVQGRNVAFMYIIMSNSYVSN